jgi:hypothetical protein
LGFNLSTCVIWCCWDHRHSPPLPALLILMVFYFKLFLVFWEWCLNSGLYVCKAGTLLLEPQLQNSDGIWIKISWVGLKPQILWNFTSE